MIKIAVINGPNMNWLGQRDPGYYGTSNLAKLEGKITEEAEKIGWGVVCYQSNSEGQMINFIQDLNPDISGYIINPAAYTHYSLALADCLAAIDKPIIEVHFSNLATREKKRQNLLTSREADGVIMGFGEQGYFLAIRAMQNILEGED